MAQEVLNVKINKQLLKAFYFSLLLTVLPSCVKGKTVTPVVEKPPAVTIHPMPEEIKEKNIILSFIGDCTIGSDPNFGYTWTFNEVFDQNNKDFGYFFRGVKSVLDKDDLTIANLETTFTTATQRAVKQFNFKGDPSYVNILKEGSVEVVNLANNHTYDYLQKGYDDTINTLKSANVNYYGNDILLIKEIDGIKIGFAGFMSFGTVKSTCTKIDEAMKYFNEHDVDIKVVTFHWGIERDNYHNEEQETLGKYAIDQGADLVVGHHPHVLQGIQEYKGKYIVFSLGNFVFGGNKNPNDKDSMILQLMLYFENDELVDTYLRIVPVFISSKKDRNDYQPTILEGEEKVRVLKRINKYSKNFQYEIEE